MLCIIGAPGHSTEFLFQIVQGIHLKNQRELLRQRKKERKKENFLPRMRLILRRDVSSFLGREEGPFSNTTDYEVKFDKNDDIK